VRSDLVAVLPLLPYRPAADLCYNLSRKLSGPPPPFPLQSTDSLNRLAEVNVMEKICLRPASRRWRAALLVAIALAAVFGSSARPRAAGSAGLVISQVYGGGGNSGATYKNDFIELFNRGTVAVDITGWSVQYAAAAGSFNAATLLPSISVAPGQHLLVQEAAGAGGTMSLPTPDATGAIAMSATAGKVALVSRVAPLGCGANGAACTDAQKAFIIDLVGYGTGSGGANFYEGSGPAATLTNTTAAIRKGDGCTDTDSNTSDFTTGGPTPRNTSSATHTCPVGPPPTSTPPAGTGLATPPTVPIGTQTLLTVSVTPGTNPTSTGLSVSADLSSIGGATTQVFFDDGSNGDVKPDDNIFSYLIAVPSGTSTGSKTLTATIADAQERTTTATIALSVALPPPTLVAIHDIQGSSTTSPLAGERVSTTGIVTGVKSNGFFIQAQQDDGDPQTSEGVFVYTGSSLPSAAGVGNLVSVIGTVQEYQSMTEISGALTVAGISTGNALPAAVRLTAADMDPAGGTDQLERYEAMRVEVDSLTVVAPTDGGGVLYGVFAGVGRPFREPGIDPSAPTIPGMPAGVPRFDGNPERLGVDGDAIGAHVINVTTNAIVTNVVGPLDYSSGSYTIDAEATPTFTGNISAIAVPAAAEGQFTVASWNMLNFSSSDATRMNKASQVIRDVMGMPDIIGVEEVSSLATLQDLANQVNWDAGSASPGYLVYLVPGNTTGQNVGFLVKASMSFISVTQKGKDATFTDPKDGSIDWLNDRPPLVLHASVVDPRGGLAFPITVVVNHSRSLISVDANTPDGLYARTKRRLGAEYLANLLQQYQQNGEHVVSVGDYNAFQFNDGYVDVIGTILGAPTPADHVLLASADLVNPNFADLIDLATAGERYSYVENGNAQALDHIIVSPNMLPRVAALAYARNNADFPQSYASDGTRPERASDHDPAVAYFTFPTADLSVSASAAPPNPVLSGSTLTYTITARNGADDDATGVTMTATLPSGVNGASATAPGWTCETTPGPTSTTVTCAAAVLKAKSDATFTVVATLDCLLPDSNLSSEVKVDATTFDPDPTNNTSTVVTTVSNPAPAITGESSTPAALWPVSHKFVPVTIAYSVADNCGPAPVCSLTVSSNERTDGRGDGRTTTDWQVIDEHNVLLRAERAGTGNGRTYTIGITCTDAGGNTGTKNVLVTVPKSNGK